MGSSLSSRRKARIVYDLRGDHLLCDLLDAAGLAASTYHMWRARFVRGEGDHIDPRVAIVQAKCAQYRYKFGYRRIRMLLRDDGYYWSGKTVLKLMRIGGCLSTIRARRYKPEFGSENKKAPNIVNRVFTRREPGQLWVTDITQVKIQTTRVYVSMIKDTCTREIIAWATGPRPTVALVLTMLNTAIASNLINPGLVLHSDQGAQYQHDTYRTILNHAGITQSMSRGGNCLDNASIESLFSHIKTEMYHNETFLDITDFTTALERFIYHYNYERPQTVLNGLTPKQARAIHNTHINQLPLPQLQN